MQNSILDTLFVMSIGIKQCEQTSDFVFFFKYVMDGQHSSFHINISCPRQKRQTWRFLYYFIHN